MAAIQGHKNPFHPELLKLNHAQLDFILEMHFQDNPKEGTFMRPGGYAEKFRPMLSAVGWVNVLRGNALARYLADKIPSGKMMAALRNRAKPRQTRRQRERRQ